MKKMSLIIITMILLSSLLVGCGKDEAKVKPYTLEGIKEKGKLVMGTSADFPPYEFHIMVDGKDTIVGFEIEIAKYIAEKLEVDLEIKDMEFSNLLAGLDTGMLDMVIAGMAPSPDREANFTKSYEPASTHNIIIRKSDKDQYKLETDLNGKTVGAQTGSIQKEMADDIEGVNVRELQSLNNLVMELKTEKIDAVVMSYDSALSFVEANNDLMIMGDVILTYKTDGASIALKKGNDELTAYLSDIVNEILEQGLVEKWKEEAKELIDQEIK